MRRKPAILLLVLLLIAGGAVVFYLHLRRQASQEFTEVDRMLRAIPESSAWKFKEPVESVIKVGIGPKWLKSLGIRPQQMHQRTRYGFFQMPVRGLLFEQPFRMIAVEVTHHSGRVTDMVIHGKSADVETIKERLLEKEPDLQPRLRLYPY